MVESVSDPFSAPRQAFDSRDGQESLIECQYSAQSVALHHGQVQAFLYLPALHTSEKNAPPLAFLTTFPREAGPLKCMFSPCPTEHDAGVQNTALNWGSAARLQFSGRFARSFPHLPVKYYQRTSYVLTQTVAIDR